MSAGCGPTQAVAPTPAGPQLVRSRRSLAPSPPAAPMPNTPDHLPEESWQRILARAAELDAREGATLPVGELRRAALEAGISATAFDRALEELPAEPRAPKAGLLHAIARPAVTLGAFWGSLAILARAAFFMGAGWQVRAGVNLVALAIGIAVGRRIGARRTAIYLLGVAASQGALLLVRLVWGAASAQGTAINWLALAAGVGGAMLATMRMPTETAMPPAGPTAPLLKQPPEQAPELPHDDPTRLEARLPSWSLASA